MGQVPTQGTPFRKNETAIKREGNETEGRGETPLPQHTKGTRKSSPNHAEDQFSPVNLVHLNLIIKNTVITVVHALRPSSLAHSLQIHYTGLTGLRSHASWAWPEKRDPTILFFFCVVFFSIKVVKMNLKII